MNAQNFPVGPGPVDGGTAMVGAEVTDAVQDVPATIDGAMAALEYLDSAPTSSHVAVFEHVHQTLTDALAAIDGV